MLELRASEQCCAVCPMSTDNNMEHREATGQRQNHRRSRRHRPRATTRLRAVTTCNRWMADGIAQGARDPDAKAWSRDAGGTAPEPRSGPEDLPGVWLAEDRGQRLFRRAASHDDIERVGEAQDAGEVPVPRVGMEEPRRPRTGDPSEEDVHDR